MKHALESHFFKGYYHIPGIERLLINKQGKVIDLRTMTCLLESPAKHEYRVVNVIGAGTLHLHRLMALTFLPPIANPDKHQVNHKNGDKRDINIDNLEWTTPSGNILHAACHGLRRDSKPVLCKNLDTGEVIRFHSQSECGMWFSVSTDVISSYIRSRSIYPFNDKYELVLENDDWRGLGNGKVIKHGLVDRHTLAIRGVEKILFDSPHAAGEYLGVKVAQVFRSIHSKGEYQIDGWSFYFSREVDIETVTRITGRPHKNNPSKKPRPIKVIDTLEGHISEWSSIDDFSYVVGYTRNTIQKSMLLNNGCWRQYQIEYIESPTG